MCVQCVRDAISYMSHLLHAKRAQNAVEPSGLFADSSLAPTGCGFDGSERGFDGAAGACDGAAAGPAPGAAAEPALGANTPPLTPAAVAEAAPEGGAAMHRPEDWLG